MTIGVIGSGAMGSGIAQVAATAGHKVIVYDNNNEQLHKAEKILESTLNKLSEKGKLNQDQALAILNHHVFTSDLNTFKECGTVIEAIVENINIKKEVFEKLETIVSSDCILASNTSSLSIASISAACLKPERVIGIHFFNPAPLMPLVEIIPSVSTSNEIVLKSKQLIDSWKKTTVICKDTPGFIVNRVARSYYGEAIRIAEEGIADYATIDWAMKHFGGFKMGPFELMDFIGNDINYKVTESVWEQFFFDPRFKPSLTQKRLFESKRFGRKSGKGYFDYSTNELPKPSENEETGTEIFNRIICMLINEAVDSLYLKVASAKDIEIAMTKGVNYPKGLLEWGQEIGWQKILNQLNNLYKLYEEDRYRASVLLKQLALGVNKIEL
jgi:3-hydroxybutyryl-CoA dehydrogenase